MNRKKSMEQVVYETIKKAILAREIAPGTQLVEVIIAERLQVSRTPIRNAIKKLQEEGLVNVIPNRGAFVMQPTREEIRQAYEFRIELECSAVPFAFSCMKEEGVQRLHEIVEGELQAYKERDILKYVELNKQFHSYLAKRTKNKFLIQTMDTLLRKINIYLILYGVFYDVDLDNVENVKDHKRMIELIEKRDVEGLQRLIRVHLQASLNNFEIENIQYKALEEIL